MDPIYILIPTSRRPKFFARMMKSIKEQTYPHIVTIVHSDNPADKYVIGDIIIHGEPYERSVGGAPYNLYNNRLLASIPEGMGWYHFLDDDDYYASPDVLDRFVAGSKRDHINVARVKRWNGQIFPTRWQRQRSFQTECFLLHTDHRGIARWWANRGGDHYYSGMVTKVLPINWIENLIVCEAQEGKGHGRCFDLGEGSRHGRYANQLVKVEYLRKVRVPQQQRGKPGDIRLIPRWRAYN